MLGALPQSLSELAVSPNFFVVGYDHPASAGCHMVCEHGKRTFLVLQRIRCFFPANRDPRASQASSRRNRGFADVSFLTLSIS